MSNAALCRVCLARDIKMHHIANTPYQEIFEKLSTKLYTADQRPETLCYICFSYLQRCRQFADMSRKAEIILTQISNNGIQTTREPNLKIKPPLSLVPMKYLSMSNTEVSFHGTFKQEVIYVKEGELKVEPFKDTAPNSSPITVKEEITSAEKEKTGELIVETELENVMSSERCNTLSNRIKFEVDDCDDVVDELPQFEVDSHDVMNELPPTMHVGQPEELTTYWDDDSSGTFSDECGQALQVKQTQMPYSCNICGKEFHQKHPLMVHMRVHTGEKPYACDKCGQKFSQQSSLKRHRGRIHKCVA